MQKRPETPWRSALRRMNARVAGLGRDREGGAATEFALVAPLLVFSLLLMGDFASALSAQDATARKARRAIEGVLRYGDDKDKVTAFANASGAAAFSSSADVSANEPEVQISKYYVCRDASLQSQIPLPEASTCPHSETWYAVSTSTTTTGLFGTSYSLSTNIDVMVNKK